MIYCDLKRKCESMPLLFFTLSGLIWILNLNLKMQEIRIIKSTCMDVNYCSFYQILEITEPKVEILQIFINHSFIITFFWRKKIFRFLKSYRERNRVMNYFLCQAFFLGLSWKNILLRGRHFFILFIFEILTLLAYLLFV